MNLLKWPIKNPVFINMLMVLFFVVGLLCLNMLPEEENPEISLNWVNITTLYNGASAEDMENLITIKMEDGIATLKNISTVTSWSGEGYSRISIKYDDMSDDEFQRNYQELVTEIGNVSLPNGSEDPIFFKWSSSTFLPVLNIAVFGEVSEIELKEAAKNLKDAFTDISSISKINVSGDRDKEVWVEVQPEKMKSLNITFDEIQTALITHNLNMTAGAVKNGSNEFMVRSIGEYKTEEELLETVVRVEGSHVLRVKDIAHVKRSFKRAATKSRFNGKNAITLSLYKKPGHGTIDVINQIKSVIEAEQNKLPPTIGIEAATDISDRITDGIAVLSSNALAGVILVIFLLHMFLGTRNAIFAAIGIPTSFLITFVFLYATGNTMNLSVMFGMVLVLGMIVDDAMVIIENVYRHMEEGKGVVEAVLVGVPEVAKPVMSSIATTIAAFLPLMLMPGIMGKFMRIIPIVVCLSLLASVVEAFFIMPVHIAKFGKLSKKEPAGDKYVAKLRNLYDRLLNVALDGRWYLVIAVFFFFLIGVGMIAQGSAPAISGIMAIIVFLVLITMLIRHQFKKRYFIPLMLIVLIGSSVIFNKNILVEMFADEPLNMVFVRLKAPQGIHLDEMERIVQTFEKEASKLPPHEVKSIISNIGVLNLDSEVINGSNVGELIVDIIPAKQQRLPEGQEKARPIKEIITELQNRTKHITGLEWRAIIFPNTGPPAGKPIEVKILGKEFTVLKEISTRIATFLESVEGVENIDSDFEEGKEEYRFYPNDLQVKSAGLTNIQIDNELQKVISGQSVGLVREADEELEILLKYPEEYITSKDRVEGIRVHNQMGEYIPLSNLGEFKEVRSLSTIKRFKRNRAITVAADLAEGKSSVEINTQIGEFYSKIENEYPGYRISFEGEFKEFETAFDGLLTLFAIGIGLMFVILGTQFKSWLRPLMILLSVPVAFVGATFGLAISNNPFSIGSMFGMVALAGVAVNSAIVLVDFIGIEREKGHSLKKSVLNAGHIRFRPIVLTSLTTIFGMLPLALGIGGSSVSWQPLAITIVCGLFFSTILTLFLIPSFYIILEDFIRFYQRHKLMRFAQRFVFSLIGVITFGGMFASGQMIMGLIVLLLCLIIGFIVDLEVHDRDLKPLPIDQEEIEIYSEQH